MAHAILAEDYPNSPAIAAALGLDLTCVDTKRMKSGILVIRDASQDDKTTKAGITALVTPKRQIMLFFENSTLLYRDVEDEIFRADQRIGKSPRNEGSTVVFSLDGLFFFFTADRSDAVVDTVFCGAPK